ncbi:MAG: rod shape-determining protein MreD [gamma proteobacterium symbiont of Bathyaustriella thionipta]|nr:rod shape-determining protein MreD [gamma proteobacterium symbiont of Bathyaustriella thionipta]
MKSHGGWIIAASFLAALLLELIPLPEWARFVRPQWSVLVLIYWSIAAPQRVGVGYAWLLGIIQDVLTGTLLGQHALGMIFVAFIANRLHKRIRVFPLWQQSMLVLLMLLLDQLLQFWTLGVIGQSPKGLNYWVPAFVGMLLWPWMFIVLRDIRRRFHVQ